MNATLLAGSFRAAVSAGAVAYVFLYPLLSGEARAEKRQKALVRSPMERRAERVAQGVNRRDQVSQSLKELEARQKTRDTLSLEQKLRQAGLAWSKGRFFLVSALMGLGSALVLFSVTLNLIAAGGALFAGSLGLPRWMLSYLKRRRINKFVDELPNAMDVIVRGVRAGLPLGDCLRVIANEAREPLRSEFRAIVETQTLGVPLTESVAKLYERVPVAEANFFAIMIAIQQKAGGNLAEAIGNLSKVIRERKKMKGKIAAMSSEAKASAGIIAALPFVVATLTYLTSPNYISLLWTTQAGQIALVGSGMWMMLGILVMKKMINFNF